MILFSKMEQDKYVSAFYFRYFPAESTQEMLDEWRPLLCPFDVTVVKGLSYLDRFLPTRLPEEQMDQGFRYVDYVPLV